MLHHYKGILDKDTLKKKRRLDFELYKKVYYQKLSTINIF